MDYGLISFIAEKAFLLAEQKLWMRIYDFVVSPLPASRIYEIEILYQSASGVHRMEWLYLDIIDQDAYAWL